MLKKCKTPRNAKTSCNNYDRRNKKKDNVKWRHAVEEDLNRVGIKYRQAIIRGLREKRKIYWKTRYTTDCRS